MPISAQHTKFTYPDYIAPLPADDFIKVAYKKQELFDEGVAKVQSTIDAYGDLRSNMLTSAEKDYFDQTMTGMVKAINSSAGLDFSVKANTQAVLNIGKPLEKDNNIVTAIKSGKEYQRRVDYLSKLDGSKRFKTNDLVYMEDIQDKIKNNKLGQDVQYGKDYMEFRDISEKWGTFFKNLPVDQQTEILKGKDTPQGYFEIKTTEGFEKSKVADMFRAYLATDPKSLQQLQIDTRAGLITLGKEGTHQAYTEKMGFQMQLAEQNVNQVKKALKETEDIYTKVPSPIVKQRIQDLKNNLANQSQKYLYAKAEAETPLESFDINDYATMYQNDLINNMANLYSGQKVKRELKEDKVWEVNMGLQKELYKHRLGMEKVKVDKYNATDKAYEINTGELGQVLKNIGNFSQTISLIQNSYKNNPGMQKALKGLDAPVKAFKKEKGINQLEALNDILNIIQSTSLGPQASQALAGSLGISDNMGDYKNFLTNAQKSITDIWNAKNSSGLNSRQEISFNNSFDYTLNALDNFDFIRNADQLGSRFAVAAPDITISTKTGVNAGTTTTTKFSQKGTPNSPASSYLEE
jgi:hypothetical protein